LPDRQSFFTCLGLIGLTSIFQSLATA